jgi:hypothetical protein
VFLAREAAYEAPGSVFVVPLLAAGRGPVHPFVVAGGIAEGVHVEGMDGLVELVVVQSWPDGGLRGKCRGAGGKRPVPGNVGETGGAA